MLFYFNFDVTYVLSKGKLPHFVAPPSLSDDNSLEENDNDEDFHADDCKESDSLE
jgi:hypothetical protein